MGSDTVTTISEKVHDQNRISGISIIGSGASAKQEDSVRNTDTKNESYINSAFVSDEVENTRLW